MTDVELEAIRDRMASHSFASELYADRAALLAEVDRLKGAVEEERQRYLRIVTELQFADPLRRHPQDRHVLQWAKEAIVHKIQEA